MFSIIVVSLNPGEKLIETMNSIRMQSFTDYQVVVKDGGSKDGSMDRLRNWLSEASDMDAKVLIVEEKDRSIQED